MLYLIAKKTWYIVLGFLEKALWITVIWNEPDTKKSSVVLFSTWQGNLGFCVFDISNPLVSSSLWSSLVCLPNLNLWKICSCIRSRKVDLFWCGPFVTHLYLSFPGPHWSLCHQSLTPFSFSCLFTFSLSFLLTPLSIHNSGFLFVLLYAYFCHLFSYSISFRFIFLLSPSHFKILLWASSLFQWRV